MKTYFLHILRNATSFWKNKPEALAAILATRAAMPHRKTQMHTMQQSGAPACTI
jgi:hypothetical protein